MAVPAPNATSPTATGADVVREAGSRSTSEGPVALDATTPPAGPPTGDEVIVELRNVWKIYKQKQRSARLSDVFRALVRPEVRTVEALRGIDLTIRRGEIVAYAGPNGAGSRALADGGP